MWSAPSGAGRNWCGAIPVAAQLPAVGHAQGGRGGGRAGGRRPTPREEEDPSAILTAALLLCRLLYLLQCKSCARKSRAHCHCGYPQMKNHCCTANASGCVCSAAVIFYFSLAAAAVATDTSSPTGRGKRPSPVSPPARGCRRLRDTTTGQSHPGSCHAARLLPPRHAIAVPPLGSLLTMYRPLHVAHGARRAHPLPKLSPTAGVAGS